MWRIAAVDASRAPRAAARAPQPVAAGLRRTGRESGARPSGGASTRRGSRSCARARARPAALGAPTAGASPGCAHPASRPRRAHPPHNNRANVRASSRSVFARAWRIPVSAGLTTTTRATCGSRIRAISHALPVTSSATQSVGHRLGRTAPAPPASSSPDPPIATCPPRDRDLAELAMHVQPDRSHHHLHLIST